jgi:NTP pyrophosphatase (non-canonical NTP hydrolase)
VSDGSAVVLGREMETTVVPSVGGEHAQPACNQPTTLNSTTYQTEIERTLSRDFHARLVPNDVLHAVLGLATETGELQTHVKKALYYGKPLDKAELVDEAGDVLWYLGTLCNCLGVSLEEVMALNIEKLRKRFPEKFTSDLALDKDPQAEATVFTKIQPTIVPFPVQSQTGKTKTVWVDNLAAPFKHLSPIEVPVEVPAMCHGPEEE